MSAKRAAALQVGAFAEALIQLGWPQPVNVHLWMAGERNDWTGQAGDSEEVAHVGQVGALASQLCISFMCTPNTLPSAG